MCGGGGERQTDKGMEKGCRRTGMQTDKEGGGLFSSFYVMFINFTLKVCSDQVHCGECAPVCVCVRERERGRGEKQTDRQAEGWRRGVGGQACRQIKREEDSFIFLCHVHKLHSKGLFHN